MIRRAVAMLATVASAAALGGCGEADADTKGVAGRDISQLSADVLPDTVLGLDVAQEDISDALSGAERTYVRSSALYGFRHENLLQATLQMNLLSEDARPESARFRATIVAQIGGSQPEQVRIGDADVFLTRGSRQRIAVWFEDDYFFILSTREDYDRPRTLLREVLEVSS